MLHQRIHSLRTLLGAITHAIFIGDLGAVDLTQDFRIPELPSVLVPTDRIVVCDNDVCEPLPGVEGQMTVRP